MTAQIQTNNRLHQELQESMLPLEQLKRDNAVDASRWQETLTRNKTLVDEIGVLKARIQELELKNIKILLKKIVPQLDNRT